ncbi:protein of unknown function [Legionella micdadei]|uniref:Uncharacterized protein n=1 Tax=Legionella micdadei TaxID=451 RepID=A0A098GB52_LEGMI|nr:protein of unknown function [Legionella micdadei]
MLVRYQAALRPDLDGHNNLSIDKRQGGFVNYGQKNYIIFPFMV